MAGNLERALAKAEHHFGNIWCSYCTPSEILALVDAGATLTRKEDLSWIRKQYKEGHSNPRWVYFWPNKELAPKLTREHNRVGTANKQ